MHVAEHGSAWMLPRLIGPMNALDLLYSVRMVDTAEADRLGLVRTLPADNFLANLWRWFGRSKSADGRPARDDRRTRHCKPRSICRKECRKEGLAHFVEKRAAVFSGRQLRRNVAR